MIISPTIVTPIKSYPVKYMVLEKLSFGELKFYQVVDTSLEGQLRIVADHMSLASAHRYAKAMNEGEGYRYD